jgi:hypothetical protein
LDKIHIKRKRNEKNEREEDTNSMTMEEMLGVTNFEFIEGIVSEPMMTSQTLKDGFNAIM